MFEAIHGSAPRRAGQNLANPSGLLLGAVLMLVHINHAGVAAEQVHNAWLRTIEDGVHTYDIFTEGVSTQKVGTKEFAAAVIARLGQKPNTLKPVSYAAAAGGGGAGAAARQRPPRRDGTARASTCSCTGLRATPTTLADAIGKLAGDGLSLQMIDNRGVKVWPDGNA